MKVPNDFELRNYERVRMITYILYFKDLILFTFMELNFVFLYLLFAKFNVDRFQIPFFFFLFDFSFSVCY